MTAANKPEQSISEAEQGRSALNPAKPAVSAGTENALPVPDPSGRPISPHEQDTAERAMLAEMERHDIDPATEWWLGAEPREVRSELPPERNSHERKWWDHER